MVKQDPKPPDELDEEYNSLKDSETDKKTSPKESKKLHKHDKKMITGFTKGFGKIVILWLISKKRQHGYEIMTQLHEAASFSGKMPSASMIYPALHNLEKKGLIKGTWEYHGKRKVKYYEITGEGEKSLERIRNMISTQKPGKTNLYQEFMEDMFFLKKIER